MIPISNAAGHARGLPNAWLVKLPALDHMPREEGPSTSLELVIEFLREL